MSWGVKIACLYIGFALLIATMVGLTMREKVDLVTPDYYAQELKFQSRIDAVNRTNLLAEQLTWKINGNTLLLDFPQMTEGKKVTGTINFFRPSDSSLDKNMDIPALIGGNILIPLGALKSGVYKMQVSWKVDDIEYYNEGVIQI